MHFPDRTLGLRGRLVVLGLLLLALLMVLDAAGLAIGYRMRVNQEREVNRQMADATGAAFLGYVTGLWDSERMMGAAVAPELAATSPGQVEALMAAGLQAFPAVRSFSWVSPDGLVLASTEPGGRGSKSAHATVRERTAQGQELILTDLTPADGDGPRTFAVARGVQSGGQLKGIIVATIAPERLHSVMSAYLMGDRDFRLSDARGTAVRVGSPATAQGHAGPQLGASVPIGGTGWVAYAGIPVADLMREEWIEGLISLAALLLIALLSVLSALVVSNRFLAPILAVQQAALAIAAGDLSARAAHRGGGEAALAAETFNHMAASIEQAEAQRAELLAKAEAARTEAEAAERRQAFLAEVSRLLASSLDHDTILQNLTQIAVPRVADFCVIDLVGEGGPYRAASTHVTPQGSAIIAAIQRRCPPWWVPIAVYSQAIMAGETIFIPEVTPAFLTEVAVDAHYLGLLQELGPTSVIAVPLRVRNRILGVLSLGLGAGDRRFDPGSVALAEDLAQRVAVAVDNARLFREAGAANRLQVEALAVLETILASLPAGFVLLDPDLRYLRVNETIAAINGKPAAEHRGRTVHEMVPAMADYLVPFLRRVLETGEPIVNWEVRRRIFPGSARSPWYMESFFPVRTPEGRMLGVGAMVVDITELKEMEEALRTSEALLAGQKQILECIAHGEPMAHVQTAIIRFLEEQSGDCRGAISLLDPTGDTLRFTAAPNLPETFRQAAERVPVGPRAGSCGTAAYRRQPVLVMDVATDPLWEGWRELALAHGIRASWSHPIFSAASEVMGVITLYFRTVREPSDLERRLVEICTHLSGIAIERSRVQEAHSLKAQSIIDHMLEGIVVADAEGRVVEVNTAALRLLQLPQAVAPRSLPETGLPAPLALALTAAIRPEPIGRPILTFTSGTQEIEARISPIVATDGQTYGVIALLHDATAEVRFRHLQEDFVANVSHELRGPLTSLSAVLEAMYDGVITEEARPGYLRSMLTEMRRLRRLTSDVLELTRLDAGMAEVERECFDIGLIVEGLEEKWGPRCSGAGVQLHVKVSAHRVLADFDRVEQVLANLLDNAIRFTPRGGSIRVTAEPEGAMVRVRIADTGIGIAPEHQEQIWERFYMVDQARTRRPSHGTGLGLPIVRHLVERMGGSVRIESELGKGSVFSFTVPAG